MQCGVLHTPQKRHSQCMCCCCLLTKADVRLPVERTLRRVVCVVCDTHPESRYFHCMCHCSAVAAAAMHCRKPPDEGLMCSDCGATLPLSTTSYCVLQSADALLLLLLLPCIVGSLLMKA
jgi:hypothetical protein